MKYKINLAKKTFIFYCLIAIPIVYASGYNLIFGVILGEEKNVSIGVFSLFGFILLPLGIYSLYRGNIASINNQIVRIGATDYPRSEYSFKIEEYSLLLKERPLFSPWKKNYHRLMIIDKQSNRIELEQDLDIFDGELAKLKLALNLI